MGERVSYQDYQVKIAPSWLQRNYGLALLSSLGAIKDSFVDQLRQAVKARMPDYAPPDALAHIGNDRGLPQGVTETNAAYATRLRTAWDTQWNFAGSGYSILTALTLAGYGNAILVQQNGLYFTLSGGVLSIGTLGGAPPNWFFTATNNLWSKFAVILPGPIPTTWTNSANAVFNGTQNYVDIIWPTPFDSLPIIMMSLISTDTDSFPIINLTNKTLTSIRVETSDMFNGSVNLLGFTAGADPFCNPQSATLAGLRQAVKKMQWGNATCGGIYAIRTGNSWGWPVQNWGAGGLNWGGNVLYIAP